MRNSIKKPVIQAVIVTCLAGLFIGCGGSSSAPKASGSTAGTTSGTSTSGDSGATVTTVNTVSTSDTGPIITGFSPSGGTVSSIPTQITVQFSQFMNESTVESMGNWNFICNDQERVILSVQSDGSSATLYLPQITGLTSGSSCSLQASPSIQSAAGTALGGIRSVTYTLATSSSTATGIQGLITTYYGGGDTILPTGSILSVNNSDRIYGKVQLTATANDASGIKFVSYYVNGVFYGKSYQSPYALDLDTTLFGNGAATLSINITDLAGNTKRGADTRSVKIQNFEPVATEVKGGSGGTAFTATAPSGFNLIGFDLKSWTYVDSISPLWQSAYGPQAAEYGNIFGGSGGSPRTLVCPSDAYRVVGIYGIKGDYIDSLGIKCARQDGTGSLWTSGAPLGGSGGYNPDHYDLQCPAGQFVTAIQGGAASLVDRLQLVCQ